MNRVRLWWNLAETACGHVTEPRIDVDAQDRAALALLRGSWSGSAFMALIARVAAAWADSWCRRLLRAAGGRA